VPDKEWYTQRELAEMFGIHIKQLYNVVSALRKLAIIRTTPDPRDSRTILIHASSVDTIKRALFSASEVNETIPPDGA
jgi:DNA-binding MarR family transcriptional regulator